MIQQTQEKPVQITPEYCRIMARYNRWQNTGLRKITETMEANALDRDHGAFFGSIRATLNHLLWADRIWMHRIAGMADPGLSIAQSVDSTVTIAEWATERFRLDGRIVVWADGLRAVDLAGEVTFTSQSLGGTVSRPIQPLIMHLFNHQTHHRGQVHAMLTAQGISPPPTDLLVMPDNA